jgi:hypothetical protein
MNSLQLLTGQMPSGDLANIPQPHMIAEIIANETWSASGLNNLANVPQSHIIAEIIAD